MVNSETDNLKVKVNCISQQEITIWVNSNSIKNKGEDHTDGLENNKTHMKDSSKEEKEMEEVHFGGLMAVGMKVTLKMVYNVEMEFFIGKVVIQNIKESGKMECFKEKVFNSLIMEKDTKVYSRKISFMEMESSIKMTPLFMEYGRITNYQLLIWLSLYWETSDSYTIQY